MSEPVSKSDVHELNYEYKRTLNTLLDFIYTKIKQAGKNTDKQVRIQVGRENVYKSIIGQEPSQNRLSEDNIKQIERALHNPDQLKGSVSISLGSELVFHAKDGKILTDSLFLVPQQKLPNAASPKPSLENVEIEITALEHHLEAQQQLMDFLQDKPTTEKQLVVLKEECEKRKETLNLILTRLETVAGQQSPGEKPQNWVGQVETKLKDTAVGMWNKVTDILTPKLDKLQQQVDERLSALELRVKDINQEFKNTLNEAKGKELAKSASKMIAILGKFNREDETVRYESNNYIFTQKDKLLSVVSKDGRGEVMNNQGFTELATSEDITSLDKINQVLEHLQVKDSILRTQGLKLGA